MGKHRRTSHAAMHVPFVQAKDPARPPQSDSLGRTTRGLVALTLVLGGLGAEAAAVAAHGGGDHAAAGQRTTYGHASTTYHLTSSGGTTGSPWMY
jgi:hypothetical protein